MESLSPIELKALQALNMSEPQLTSILARASATVLETFILSHRTRRYESKEVYDAAERLISARINLTRLNQELFGPEQ